MEKREKKRNFLNYFQNVKVLSVIDKHLPRIIALGTLGCGQLRCSFCSSVDIGRAYSVSDQERQRMGNLDICLC